MKIKYINLNRNYKNKLYKITKQTILMISISTLIGCGSKENTSSETETIEVIENFEEILGTNNIDLYSKNVTNNKAHQLNSMYNTTPSVEETIEIEVMEENQKKLVAITFDDGPGKYTKQIAEVLEENNAEATFFFLGPNVEKYKEAIKYTYETGNEIGIHGYTHQSFTDMSIEEAQNEIDLTKQLIENCGIECSNLVRPPYGSINNNIVENIDSTFILWNVDTKDWKSRDVEKIKEEVIGKIDEGDIILFHDIYKSTLEAISEILKELSDEYEFVTVSELFNLKQQEYEQNKKYYKVK